MAFGYEFIDLTEAQKHQRRTLLDRYALYAQLSSLLPFAIIQCLFLLSRWRQRYISQNDIQTPGSPSLKGAHFRRNASWKPNMRRLTWWLGDEIVVAGTSLGTNGQILFAGVYTVWLLWLCSQETGPDYLHLTKRFGIVAASQLPVHYLLSSRAILRPSAQLFNAYHQLLGRIITILLYLHAAFYLNFYVQKSLLASKLQEAYVLCGIAGVNAFTAIGITSSPPIRKYSYRVFYIAHITLASAIIPLLFFHVAHIRIYLYESVAIYAANIVLRLFTTTTVSATLSPVPSTNLLEIDIPFSNNGSSTLRSYHSAQYAYISLPGHPASRSIRSNPFTLASLPSVDKHLRFYARALDGNTSNLALQHGPRTLGIEGPLGPATHADTLLRYDRVLFVAGGVGATFIVPLYRQLLADLSPSAGSMRRQRVKFVWAARRLEDAQWAFPGSEYANEQAGFEERSSLFVTGSPSGGRTTAGMVEEDEEPIELAERKDLLSAHERSEKRGSFQSLKHEMGRPNMRRIVDEAFAHGSTEKVAVMVCGPKSLSRTLRHEVGRHVKQGREVWFWEEAFEL